MIDFIALVSFWLLEQYTNAKFFNYINLSITLWCIPGLFDLKYARVNYNLLASSAINEAACSYIYVEFCYI